jgi:Flp pilus assembly protein TadD
VQGSPDSRAFAGFASRLVLVPVGCGAVAALLGCSAGGGTNRTTHAPTFTNVAPILSAHCVGCHRPGHAAPFPLTTYEQVQARAGAIDAALAERRMPPWLPDHGAPAFVGERRLDDAELTTLREWIASGAAKGSGAVIDVPPEGAWELGAPDVVATSTRPFVLKPGDHDVYRNLILQVPATQVHYVRAVEFRPGTAPVHHAVIRIDPLRTSRRLDGTDGESGFGGMAAYDVQDPDGHFLGWAPGRGPIVAPDSLPWTLAPGSDLVVELHLMPGHTAVEVNPQIALYFAARPPERTPVMIVLGSKAIDIPAGASDYTVEDRFQLPVDAEVLSVYPHAHYLGRSMDVRAISPDGRASQLLHIRRWSFNWQQDYRLAAPIRLSRGTTIAMRYTYDNSAQNRANPHRPPQRVLWGTRSDNEMGNLGVQLLTGSTRDADELGAAYARHAAAGDVAGAEMLTRVEPDNPAHAAFLGTSYLRLGRVHDAIAPLERSLRLDPQSAIVENHLAGALLAIGRSAEALTHMRNAVALASRDAHLRYNLGKLLADSGRLPDALAELTRAIAIDPDLPEAHHQLGALMFARGRLAPAIEHLSRAAQLAPNTAVIHADLGAALAEAGRIDEATTHLKRALALDPADTVARENLSRLTAR